MDSLIELVQNYSFGSIVTIIVLIILSLFGIYEIATKVKDMLDNYYKERNDDETRQDDIDRRFAELEKSEEDDKRQLAEIKSDLEDVKLMIKKMEEEQDKVTAAQMRVNHATSKSTALRISAEILDQGYSTVQQNEVLSDIVGIFMQTSSDGHYVIPAPVARAMKTPVLLDDEIEKLHKEEKQNN